MWFGYGPCPEAKMAWGARAIFKPSAKYPLDLLPDRQGHKYEDKAAYDVLADFINKEVLPKLQQYACYFTTDETKTFALHFDWPHDANMKVVAKGSPNGSYGYFYLSVSLVSKEDAEKHPEVRHPRQLYEAQRQKEVAETQEENARTAPLIEADKKEAKAKKKRAKKEVEEKSKTADLKKSGERLEVGNRLTMHVNQGDRTAFVLGVIEDEALVEYSMPKGDKFFVVVHAVNHGVIRTIPKTKMPKKWQQLIGAA